MYWVPYPFPIFWERIGITSPSVVADAGGVARLSDVCADWRRNQSGARKDVSRSRNLRLTAIRSFFRYVAFELPTHAGQIQRVLSIPAKRYQRTLVAFLARPEVEALLQVPDLTIWSGRRDHALMLLALQTGLRLSEIIALNRDDLIFGVGAHVRALGKGRKERCTPLAKRTAEVLKQWLKEPPRGNERLLFTNACRFEYLNVSPEPGQGLIPSCATLQLCTRGSNDASAQECQRAIRS